MVEIRHKLERGETLVEILVTVVIISIAFVGIFGGLATGIQLSARHRQSANAATVLAAASDAVKGQSYVPCPSVTTASYIPTQGVTLPSGWSSANVVVTAVAGWNGSTFGPCGATDGKLERVSIRVTAPSGHWTEQVDIVKRNPA